ncbi:MAG: cytochrome c maturation protein CcmE [Proteobacteria bacterium]|nr:cytochrome c maturation protein CcmE [Pseudomonadota bacterium]
MKRKHKRLTFVIIAMSLLGVAAALMLTAFEENIVFFYTPTDIIEKKITDGRRFRLGGLVEEGSVQKATGAVVNFRVTDLTTAIPVSFKGILPDLFREGQGIVAEGRLSGGVFRADEVLAKHDETYMPPEVAEALKKSGQWKGPGENKGKDKAQ